MLATVLMAVAHGAYAQATATISSVTIRGNKNITVDAISAAMKVKVGRPLVQKELLDDEAAIRNMGYFQDVKVLNRVVTETEAEVIVEVAEYPVVREVKVVGNTVISTEDITTMALEIGRAHV